MTFAAEIKRKNTRQCQEDYAHHSRRRERFREAARKAQKDSPARRDVFGRRDDAEPLKGRFSFLRTRRA